MTDTDAVISDAVALLAEDDIPEGEPIKVATVQSTALSTTVVAVIRAGHGLRPHTHNEHDEIIVFHRGEADYRLGDEIRPVRAGDVISIPAGVIHGTAQAKSTCVVTAVFAPPFGEDDPDRQYADE